MSTFLFPRDGKFLKAGEFIRLKVVEVPNTKLRAGHIKILGKRVMMVVMVAMEMVVEKLVAVEMVRW